MTTVNDRAELAPACVDLDAPPSRQEAWSNGAVSQG